MPILKTLHKYFVTEICSIEVEPAQGNSGITRQVLDIIARVVEKAIYKCCDLEGQSLLLIKTTGRFLRIPHN